MKTVIYYCLFLLSLYVSITLAISENPQVNFIPRVAGMFAIPLVVAKIMHEASKT